ncbi:MAG: glycosyltransferase family 2 protein [Solirubrobacterales bacterium]|nr:glycosyltransferase family 2 protein [Solirubrobacterales bacterium]
MWQGKTVTVILMTYAEKDSIRAVIDDFFATGYVDEVLVVNNNAEPGTAEEVEKTEARQVFERQQGYGHAIRRGLLESESDLVVLAEPDGTFLAQDIVKLLAYSDEVDIVLGTRTTTELIWEGANMGAFLKWGNWAVAKMVEVLFNTSHLSDIGCTYRLMNRETAERFSREMTIGGSHAGPQMLMLTLKNGLKFVEVPVNYLPRVGTSSVTGSYVKAFFLGLQMIRFILGVRFGRSQLPESIT